MPHETSTLVTIEPDTSDATRMKSEAPLKNDLPVTAGFLVPQKRASLLQKYQWLVKDYENNDTGKYSTLPVPTYIFPNQSSSCFIDASFELLLNAVLPFVNMSFADQSNVYDSLLVNAYESYSQQPRFGIRAATLTVRQFVWNMTEYKIVSGAPRMVKTFPKGHEGDTHDLASKILQRLSGAFTSKICTFSSLQCEREVS
ncbi:GTP-binding protein [Mucor velutinosus]|uniref:GTP-binding protein n=1 Tax=Mucor velutinosus TaxID=708070 RepID=A0AAN7I2V3_9FUNG|nr:GTP-binding protein [Mucor velutinosus]